MGILSDIVCSLSSCSRISTFAEVVVEPTSLAATQAYTPASRVLTLASASSTTPSWSRVMTARRLALKRTPSRYQVTPTEGYASTTADIRNSSPEKKMFSFSERAHVCP